MVVEPVRCPHCQSGEGVKYGTTTNGKERLRCQKVDTYGRTFIRAYAYPGRIPQVKRQIVEMRLNGSGLRDIARVLQISPTTGIEELKKRPQPSSLSTRPSWRGAAPRRSRKRYAEWRLPKWMRCGVLSEAQPTSAGCGMRLIISPGWSWPMSWGAAPMPSLSRCKPYSNPLGLSTLIGMRLGSMNGTCPPLTTP